MRTRYLFCIYLALILAVSGCKKEPETTGDTLPKQPVVVVEETEPDTALIEPALQERPVLPEAVRDKAPSPPTQPLQDDVSEQTEYFAVFMEGKKVGYAIQSRIVVDEKVTTTEEVSITISRADVPITINMAETCFETRQGKPLGFEVSQDMSIMTMHVAGTVDEKGVVNVTTTSMGTEQKSTLEWPSGAVMAEGLRLLTLEKGFKEGSNYTAKIFSPGILNTLEAKIQIGSKQNVDLLGRVVALTEVTTSLNMPGAGEISSITYLDDNLRTQKSVMPVAGLHVEMVACAKEFALGENDVLELVDKMFVQSPQPLGNLASVKSVTYEISATKQTAKLTIPSDDNQKVEQPNGKILITVEPVSAAAGVGFPYMGGDEKIMESTKPTRFLQSDRKEIIELAGLAIGGTKDSADAVKKIEAFVADYIENTSLSVGYASAAEVAASRQGDCSEFAVLTAALCRAAGIPAQVVVGIAYVEDFAGHQGFGGHAWTQAYIGDKWVGLDAAFKSTSRGGYDAGHIALAAGGGEPADFLNMASTLGQFKIDKVTISRR